MTPEPIVIDGRSGVVLYINEHWDPVPSAEALFARVLFDDGGSAFFAASPKAPVAPTGENVSATRALGGPGSGNFGHSGRPGAVGGSAPSWTGGGRDLNTDEQMRAAGGPGSGNFGHAGRPGEVGGSSSDGGAPKDRASVAQRFDMATMDRGTLRLMLFDPEYGKLVLGKEIATSEADEETHAPIYAEATGSSKGYDDMLRGFIRAPSYLYPTGMVEAYDGALIEKSSDNLTQDEKAFLFQLDAEAAEFAVTRLGAKADTLFHGPVAWLNRGKAQPIGERYPELFARKRRALGGPGSGNFGHAGRPGEVGGSASGTSDAFFADLMSEGQGMMNPFDDREIVINRETAAELSRTADGLRLHSIRSFVPRTGAGTRAMQLIMKLADKHGFVLTGTAKPFDTGAKGTLKSTALKQWYQKLGFTVDRSGDMVRQPLRTAGGKGSGNFGHKGRPGEVGGSGPGGSDADAQHFVNMSQGIDMMAPIPRRIRPESFAAGFVKMYHVTDVDSARKINKEGFDTESKNQFQGFESAHKAVYGWSSLDRARMEIQRTEDMSPGSVKDFAIIEFQVPKSQWDRMLPDEDTGTDDWKQSYKEMSAGFGGDVPTDWIVGNYLDASSDALKALGGKGSGNFGHKGRPGEVGGSSADGSTSPRRTTVAEKRAAGKAEADHQEALAAKQTDPLANPPFVMGRPHIWNVERYVAAYGERFESAPLPEDVERGQMGQCYKNASLLVLMNPELTFAEGFAQSSKTGSIAFMHAWAVTADGKVVDPTWDEPEKGHYFGVKYDRKSYLKMMQKQKYYGVIGAETKIAQWAVDSGGKGVRAESRELGGKGSGNFGHAGRPGVVGGSSAGRLAQLARKLPHTDDPRRTAFLLPDGTRLMFSGAGAQWHKSAIGKLGFTLQGVLSMGVVRYKAGEGIEVNSPITQEQAQIVIDDAITLGRSSFAVDTRAGNTPEMTSRTFDVDRISAGSLVDYVKSRTLVRALGGPGSGNFGHAGRPGQVGGSASDGFDNFSSQVKQVLSTQSRTVSGTRPEAAEISKDKPELGLTGGDLTTRVAGNVDKALSLAWSKKSLDSPEDAEQFVTQIAAQVSEGVLQPGQSPLRTWTTPFQQTDPPDIPKDMREFGAELYDRVQSDEDPIVTAAWLEQRLDGQIHPFADGVGRTTKILSNWVLHRAGVDSPSYPPRKEYYGNIKKSLADWTDFYRGLISPKMAEDGDMADLVVLGGRAGVVRYYNDAREIVTLEEATFAKVVFDDGEELPMRSLGGLHALGGPGSGNFGHAGRPGSVGGSAKKASTGDDLSKGKNETPEIKAILAKPSSAYPKAQDGPTIMDIDYKNDPDADHDRPRGLDTLQQFTQADGTITPERRALHDAIVEKMLAGHEKPEGQAVAHLMGGGGASGKSVMQKMLDLPDDQIHIDVDIIRTHLPEWDEELNLAKAEGRHANDYLGNFTHEEASLISKMVIDRAAKGGFNLMVDGAGDTSIEKVEQNVARYKAGGQRVVGDYVTVDYDTAYARMRARGDKTGRYIPAAHLRAVHAEVARVFPKAVERGLFDEFSLWDTTDSKQGPDGKFSPPTKVASGRGKELVIHDQVAWQRFMDKRGGIAKRPGEI